MLIVKFLFVKLDKSLQPDDVKHIYEIFKLLGIKSKLVSSLLFKAICKDFVVFILIVFILLQFALTLLKFVKPVKFKFSIELLFMYKTFIAFLVFAVKFCNKSARVKAVRALLSSIAEIEDD